MKCSLPSQGDDSDLGRAGHDQPARSVERVGPCSRSGLAFSGLMSVEVPLHELIEGNCLPVGRDERGLCRPAVWPGLSAAATAAGSSGSTCHSIPVICNAVMLIWTRIR